MHILQRKCLDYLAYIIRFVLFGYVPLFGYRSSSASSMLSSCFHDSISYLPTTTLNYYKCKSVSVGLFTLNSVTSELIWMKLRIYILVCDRVEYYLCNLLSQKILRFLQDRKITNMQVKPQTAFSYTYREIIYCFSNNENVLTQNTGHKKSITKQSET